MVQQDKLFYVKAEPRKRRNTIFPMLFVFAGTLIVIFGSIALIVFL